MYKCINCNKEFKYESEFNRHNNKIIKCNSIKKEYKCEICNVEFKCPYDKNKHEKTKKHIANINIKLDLKEDKLNIKSTLKDENNTLKEEIDILRKHNNNLKEEINIMKLKNIYMLFIALNI